MEDRRKETEKRREQYKAVLRKSPLLYQTARELAPADADPAETAAWFALAPALGGFVRWLLAETLDAGHERLYFLARDGYFMYRAALVLCSRLGLPVDCRYLSLSRYSLRLPLFHLDRRGALDAVCRGGVHVTLRKILRRAGLTPLEQQEVLRRLPLSLEPDADLSWSRLPQIRRALEGCGLFLERMDAHSRAALPGLKGYLLQEGLTEKVSAALVDSGWTGSLQDNLNRALAHMGRRDGLEGYYWGLYELPPGARCTDYHWYAFGPAGQLREKVYFNNCLFEAVYTAPHGMTLGYEKRDGRFIPRYGAWDPQRETLFRRLQDVFSVYIRRLAEEGLTGDPAGGRDRETVCKLLSLFMGFPTKGEALAFGGLPFSDDVLEGEERPLAARLTEGDFSAHRPLRKLLAMGGFGRASIPESAWFEGSAVLYARRPARRLRQHTVYKYMRYIRKARQYKRGKVL